MAQQAIFRGLLGAMVTVFAVSCAPPPCAQSADCAPREVCQANVCTALTLADAGTVRLDGGPPDAGIDSGPWDAGDAGPLGPDGGAIDQDPGHIPPPPPVDAGPMIPDDDGIDGGPLPITDAGPDDVGDNPDAARIDSGPERDGGPLVNRIDGGIRHGGDAGPPRDAGPVDDGRDL